MINGILNKQLPRAYDGALKDAVHSFTGKREGDRDSYDPVTDTYVNSPAVTYSGRGTIKKYTASELMVTEIDITDVKFSCLQIECTGVPAIGDEITLRGMTGRVMTVSPSSTGLKWVMQLRGLNVG